MATVAIPGRRTRGALSVQATNDRDLIRGFLETDRLFAAYALCDLEDRDPQVRQPGRVADEELTATE